MNNLPTVEQIKAGNEFSSLLFDCSMANALGDKPNIPGKYADLINAYLSGEIDAVSAIFTAMMREGGETCGKDSS